VWMSLVICCAQCLKHSRFPLPASSSTPAPEPAAVLATNPIPAPIPDPISDLAIATATASHNVASCRSAAAIAGSASSSPCTAVMYMSGTFTQGSSSVAPAVVYCGSSVDTSLLLHLFERNWVGA